MAAVRELQHLESNDACCKYVLVQFPAGSPLFQLQNQQQEIAGNGAWKLGRVDG